MACLSINGRINLQEIEGLLTICSLFSTEDYGDGAKSYNGEENQDGAVHKEVLGENADDLVLPPAEEPVGFSGEEDLVEYGEGLIKVQGAESTDNTEADQGEKSGGEDNASAEGAEHFKDTDCAQDHQNSQANHGGDKRVKVQVKEHLAILKVGFAALAVLKVAGLKLVAGDGEVVHQLVICRDDSLAVGARVLLDIQRVDLIVVEGADVDGESD